MFNFLLILLRMLKTEITFSRGLSAVVVITHTHSSQGSVDLLLKRPGA